MTPLPTSVIVVSRGRPAALRRCLIGLAQLDHPNFEVIVVADPEGVAEAVESELAGTLKIVEFDEANISQSRNLGINIAAGEIIAFIDDDSVAEPTWLTNLTAVFEDADVIAAGGYVLGRNGISLQSTAAYVDCCGDETPIEMQGDQPQVFRPTGDQAIKTEGTNCAFRRQTLVEIGGFDTAFRFFLDETDVNKRLGKLGHKTAIVPLAQVHHGFAESAQRQVSRMPKTLFDIGASLMVFLRKHAPTDRHSGVIANMRSEQRARLLRHMVAGNCEPAVVERVMGTFEVGVSDGKMRQLSANFEFGETPADFKITPRRFSNSSALAGRPWSSKILHSRAAGLVRGGVRASVFRFSPTAAFHHVKFVEPGYWLQTGGIFGRSKRIGRLVRWANFAGRVQLEIERVAKVRGNTEFE